MKIADITVDTVYTNGKGRFRLVLKLGNVLSDHGVYVGVNAEYVAVALRKKGRFLVVEPDRYGGHLKAEPWKSMCTKRSLASWATAEADWPDAKNVRNALTQHLASGKPYDLAPKTKEKFS